MSLNPLFSEQGLKEFESWCAKDTLFAWDYDGTLSPIVTDPMAAVMRPRTRSLMETLCTLAPVAVISGRRLGDLRERMEIHPRYSVGNHGLEGISSGAFSLETAENICKKWIVQMRSLFSGELLEQGLEIEDKRYSISLHYRQVSDQAAAIAAIEEAIPQLQPAPRRIGGKCVVNLVPAGGPDKGVALLELMRLSGAKRAVFIGDDVTDEDVFKLNDERVLSIRVEPEDDTAASYFIPAQADVDRLLETAVSVMSQGKSKEPQSS